MMTPDSSSLDNNNQLGSSSALDTNSIGSSADGGQLSTVFEFPHRKHGEELRLRESSLVTGLPTSTQDLPASHSRDASPRSTAEQSYTEKLVEPPPRRLKHKPQSISARERDEWLKSAGALSSGTYEDTMASNSPITTPPKKLKTRGLGTIIRRMFGRRSKDRISMPGPQSYQNDPNSFITSAADLSKVPRASSAPSQDISRSSALGSHAPYNARAHTNIANVEAKIPPRPERSPERPTRLRQASLPIASLNFKDREVSIAPIEFGQQTARDNAVHTASTEFFMANSKRRSRSAGASHDTAREHRMSPIQWRQFRRRSAEIRYWRESTDAGSPVLGNTTFMGSELLQTSPVHPHGRRNLEESTGANDRPQTGIERNHESFNFGVPISELEPQEQVTIEERMVTLEIKLMDFEYAISKLQAGLASSSQPSHQVYLNEEPRTVRHSSHPQIRPVSSRYHAKRPSDESYSPISSHSTPAPSFQRPFQPLPQSSYQQHHNENRPASSSTTVRAAARDRSTRLSFTALTIDHYTTLITLIRHEQSARLRLEDQVLHLERQIQQLQSSPWPQHENSISIRGDLRRRLSSPRDTGGENSPRGRYRRPSHVYSEGEVDTDEQSFHDVYVTPAERGEFERARLAAEEEGVAF